MKNSILKALRYHAEHLPTDDSQWDRHDDMVFRAIRGHLRHWLNDLDLDYDTLLLILESLDEEDSQDS